MTSILMICKNKLRQSKGLLIYYLIIGFMLFFAVSIFGDSIMKVLEFFKVHTIYFNLIFALILFLIIVFKHYPIVLINPATIHYLFGTNKLKRLFYVKFSILSIYSIIWALIITICVNYSFNIGYFINIALFLIAWINILWKKSNKSIPFVGLLIWFIIISIPFILMYNNIGIFLYVLTILACIYTPTNINWVDYISTMKFLYKSQSALARKDYAGMAVIASENGAKDNYNITFSDKVMNNPLITKSIIIDGFRANKINILLKITVFLTIIGVYFLSIFSGYETIIFNFLWSALICIILKECVQTTLSMKRKSDMGLFLPYNIKNLVIDFSVYPSVTILLFSISLILFTYFSIWNILFSNVAYWLILYCWNVGFLKNKYNQKIIDAIASTSVYLCTYLIF